MRSTAVLRDSNGSRPKPKRRKTRSVSSRSFKLSESADGKRNALLLKPSVRQSALRERSGECSARKRSRSARPLGDLRRSRRRTRKRVTLRRKRKDTPVRSRLHPWSLHQLLLRARRCKRKSLRLLMAEQLPRTLARRKENPGRRRKDSQDNPRRLRSLESPSRKWSSEGRMRPLKPLWKRLLILSPQLRMNPILRPLLRRKMTLKNF